MMHRLRAVLYCTLALALAAPIARATPEETTARILDTLDTSGPFVFATEGTSTSLSVWWAGTAFVVSANNEPVTDASTFIDEAGRLCFQGNFDAFDVPAISIVVDYPPEAPWLMFEISRAGSSTLFIAPDNELHVCIMEKCKCKGPGTTVVIEHCTDANCDAVDICKKTQESGTGFCQWTATMMFCELRPELPIQEDDEMDP